MFESLRCSLQARNMRPPAMRSDGDKEKLRLALIFGGRSGEHEVSLMSARSVLSVLDPAKYEVTQVGITIEGKWLTGEDVISKMESGKLGGLEPAIVVPDPSESGLFVLRDKKLERLCDVDVYFPLLHGTFGEDGTIQGLFEMANEPWCSSSEVRRHGQASSRT
jgi:D-alanine-D-alanine ligase